MALHGPLVVARLEVPELDGGVLGGGDHDGEHGVEDHPGHRRSVTRQLELLRRPGGGEEAVELEEMEEVEEVEEVGEMEEVGRWGGVLAVVC